MGKLMRLPEKLWDEKDSIVQRCLPDDEKEQKLFLTFVEGIARAERTRDLLEGLGITWAGFTRIYYKSSELYTLYREAQELGEAYRQILREEEADRRAMEGVEEPVFFQGTPCGTIRKFSDQMLAIQLKAGNPEKYAERKSLEMKGVILNLSVEGVTRDPN
jgi:hypothetical protein